MLNNISNHDNVGAAFRNAAAFGADGVMLDERSCDPLYRKAIRVSAGSSLWLPYVQAGDGAGQIAALHDAGFEVWAMTPRETAEPLHEVVVPDKVAVLLGAEGTGLPDDLIAAARPVAIPMQRGFDSVNVATAGAIALSHVFNARQMG
jgi:tRNA G18 (ribose-2'-O)-methylase SpoU